MRATMDALDTVELPEITNSPSLSSLVSFPAVKLPGVLRKKPQEKWTSSLTPHDLRCLLAVLETSVIPQLVQDYTPATNTPLLDRSGG